jgi:UDP:flavonoid glycosyltransferase YjiC (YdhE family)
MRIAILATGSRGDVQPYLALGDGLQRAGHEVRLATHQNFAELVASVGLEFWPVAGNVQEIAESPAMRELLEKGNFLAIMGQMAKEAQRTGVALAEGGLAACRGVDLILGGMGGLYVGLAVAETLNLPFLQAYVVPFTPTAAFPSVLLPQSLAKLGGTFNRLSHQLTRQMVWQSFRTADKLARQQVLGLPAAPFGGPYGAVRLQQLPILYGFSPAVIPPPTDWDARVQVTGYWFLDTATDWTPPPALLDFLHAGPPPVYIGFGSMSSRNPAETAAIVLQALARAGQRGIILAGWGGLSKDQLPETVFAIDAIPHTWLFPRVAAVVHHGGAGTTAAGLRAGVPGIVIPFFGDQPFWGQRVADLGVGPAPIPRKHLTVDRLAQALQAAVTDRAMRQRATELGARISAEDGVACAVAVVESVLQR